MYAIVPAGGVGSRLWPLSRRDHPKFLLDLAGGGRSMLQATLDRLAPVSEGLIVVTGERHSSAVGEQVGDLAEVIAEPSPRDSMAAIGLALAIVHHRHGPSLVGSFAADHVIADGVAFERAVRAAQEVARSGYVVTLGITPTWASPGYGYIHPATELPGGLPGLLAASFEEKPEPATAERYVSEGYLWNAGMYVMSTDVVLAALQELHPELHSGLLEIAAAWDTPQRGEVLDAVWETLPKMVIDRAIAEPLAERGQVAVIPASVGWGDIGDFDTLADLTPSPPTINIDGGRAYAHSTKPVVVLGVEDAVVIETDEVILVTRRGRAQDVKDVVDMLPGSEISELA